MSITINRLQKFYGKHAAVNDLSFEVPSGTLFAFLGANGAGKSTTIGCVTTTLSPTSGRIAVNGYDVVRDADEVRKRIGVVFQQSLLDPLVTAEENLRVRAGFYQIHGRGAHARISELSTLIGLDTFLRRPCGQLSGGQKRRADIARALIHEPEVIFLDEPTAGLDPQSREQMWSAIHDLRQKLGVTVFLTTHYMEETERADSVCIIDAGRIVAEGTPAELRAAHSSSTLTVRGANLDAIRRDFTRRGLQPRDDGNDVTVAVSSAAHALDVLNQVHVDDFEFRHGTMDDVFLTVTKGTRA